MFLSDWRRSAACLLAAAAAGVAGAQTPPLPAAVASAQAAPAAPDSAQAYAEFELGKWAELQAETKGGPDFIKRALQHYTAAMAADPHSAFIAAQMADLLSRLGRTDDATSLAQSVVKEHPGSIVAHETLGTIYLRQLSHQRQPIRGAAMDAAMAEYKKLVALAPGKASYLVVLGKLYGAQGQPVEAEEEFRAALALDPISGDAVASLVQSLAGQGRLNDARKAIEALPPEARGGQAYATLGDAYLNQHLYREAADAFRQAVAARPDDPDYQRALAQALAQDGNFAAALAEYQRLQREIPEDGDAPLRVAQMQMQMGDLAAAGASLDLARARLGANDLEVAYATAMLDESKGHDRLALAALRALAARPGSPGTQVIILTELARVQMRTGDSDGALASLHQIEGLGPSYRVRAHALEAELYSQQRDFPRALAAVRAALHDQPDSRSLHLTYANLLAASGQTAAAEAEVRPLMQGNAVDWDLYLALG
ncbi:MAG: tetratricopeptide repeat protein, partial [Terriglobales bacterium]